MKKRVVAAIALTSAAVAAGPGAAFELDYPAIFERHADAVRQISQTERVLDLPGPVKLIARREETGATRYVGLDLSGLGPAGCGLETLANAIVFARQCAGVLSAEELEQIEALAERVAGFVGANASVGGAHDPAAILAQALDSARPLPCPAEGNKSAAYAGQVRSYASPQGAAAMERMLSKPRLPVCGAQIVPSEG